VAINPHFESAESWTAAEQRLAFRPVEPRDTAGLAVVSMRIHVRDHKLRELSLEERTLEVSYGAFVLSQSRRGADEARRLALEVAYGQAARELEIAGHSARVYELGPEPPPDDIDGRMPSVLTWHDAEMFYLIASGEMAAERLVQIAQSMYSL
jgi:hypothetical protein